MEDREHSIAVATIGGGGLLRYWWSDQRGWSRFNGTVVELNIGHSGNFDLLSGGIQLIRVCGFGSFTQDRNSTYSSSSIIFSCRKKNFIAARRSSKINFLPILGDIAI